MNLTFLATGAEEVVAGFLSMEVIDMTRDSREDEDGGRNSGIEVSISIVLVNKGSLSMYKGFVRNNNETKTTCSTVPCCSKSAEY